MEYIVAIKYSKDLLANVTDVMYGWMSFEQDAHNYTIKVAKKDNNQILYGLDAAHFTIDYITKNYPAPYTLCLSGGVDSQAMLYAWHTSGKSYNTMSVIYNVDMNLHDLQTLDEFSTQHSIKINYVDFDLLNFYQTDYLDYVHQYKCGSPHFCTFMKFSELVKEGTVLFSGNPLIKNNYRFFGTNELGLYRYGQISGRNIVAGFFLETKEIAYSFQTPNLFSDETKGHIARSKIESYRYSGYPVISQKEKITGFEKIKDYYDANYSHLVTTKDKLYRGYNGSMRTYDLLLRNKYERLYNDKYNMVFL